ncbi:MAG: hypothetical protein E7171_08035 [Firmicutes bacterium]|nr:hypothetical protein [Bacillota bacterium]
MKNKIIDSIRFTIGVVTLILVFIFKSNLSTVGLVAGVGVALYGVCSLLMGERLGYVFSGLGSSLFISIIIYKMKILPQFESITFFMCLSLSLIVIISIIFDEITDKEMKKKHSLEVESTVIDLVKNPNTNKEFYQPIYEYVIDDVVMEVGAPGYYEKRIPKLGDKLIIYVNPEDHLDVYFEKGKRDKIYNIAVGLFLLIASIVIIISLFV